MDAGCKFFAGYPITPASGIFKSMIDRLPSRGGVSINAPDEISAIAYCIGASMRGFKAMTATSGPGWALMIESAQYALMTETPLVVALVQRLGPSTGGATQGAQGDVLLAEFATSGGYTIPILCPSDARECYDLTVLAFTWSELLRTPVILLTDKEVAMTTEGVDYARLPKITAQERSTNFDFNDFGDFQKHKRKGTYYFEQPQEIPAFAPVGGERKVTATGSAHDKLGKLQKNSPETLEVLRHLEEKLYWRLDDLSVVKADLDRNATTLVISYGITARTAREAVKQARLRAETPVRRTSSLAGGHSGLPASQNPRRQAGVQARAIKEHVSFLNIQSLFPIPAKRITQALKGIRRVVIAEENMKGLYASVIRHLIPPDIEIRTVNKIGSMITPQEILTAICESE